MRLHILPFHFFCPYVLDRLQDWLMIYLGIWARKWNCITFSLQNRCSWSRKLRLWPVWNFLPY